jgi:hypothetical protein
MEYSEDYIKSLLAEIKQSESEIFKLERAANELRIQIQRLRSDLIEFQK